MLAAERYNELHNTIDSSESNVYVPTLTGGFKYFPGFESFQTLIDNHKTRINTKLSEIWGEPS
jgi:hypothetical protein